MTFRRYDVACLGEALVDMLPSKAGPLHEVPTFHRHAGGALANVAVGVARLGGRSALIGTVGADPFGRFLRDQLEKEGVDVSAVHAVKGPRTGIAFVSLTGSGQPSFYSAGHGGAELALTDREVRAFPVEDASIFHLGTYALSSPATREAALRAVLRARAADVIVALDPNLRLHLWPDQAGLKRLMEELLPQVDVIKLSRDECDFVTGSAEPVAAAKNLVASGPTLAVVTTGAGGCVYAQRLERRVEQGEVPVRPARVIDSTGAGDAFMSVLLLGLARHRATHGRSWVPGREALEKLLAFANESGARVCEHVGAMSGLPSAEELRFPDQ